MSDTPEIRRARALRRDMTKGERRLWRLLRGKQLAQLRFRRQAPIGPYVADFACFAPRIVVELDGEHHAADAGRAHDRVRDAWFAREGFAVVRLWVTELDQSPEGALMKICEAAGKSPHPPPR